MQTVDPARIQALTSVTSPGLPSSCIFDLYSQSTDAGFASEPTGIAKARGTPLARSAEADRGMRGHLCVRIECTCSPDSVSSSRLVPFRIYHPLLSAYLIAYCDNYSQRQTCVEPATMLRKQTRRPGRNGQLCRDMPQRQLWYHPKH